MKKFGTLVFVILSVMAVEVKAQNDGFYSEIDEAVDWFASKADYLNVEHNVAYCGVEQKFTFLEDNQFFVEDRNLKEFQDGGIDIVKLKGDAEKLFQANQVRLLENEYDERYKILEVTVDGVFRYERGMGWNSEEVFTFQVLDKDDMPNRMQKVLQDVQNLYEERTYNFSQLIRY